MVSACVMPAVAHAQIFDNPIRYGSFGELLLAVLNGITLILLPFIALGIVFIGFRLVLTGASQPEKFGELKNSLIWALVGLFLVLGANGIIRVIQNTVQPILADGEEVSAAVGTVLPSPFAVSVSAQTAESTVEGLSLAGFTDTIIQVVGGVLIPLAISLLFLAFVFSVVRYLFAAAGGEKDMHKLAVKRLVNPVLILFCVFMLWGIVEIIRQFFQ